MATGTREWSGHSANCCLGCSHACVYCYARAAALRFGRIRRGRQWADEHPMTAAEIAADPKFSIGYRGIVMFPTAHDITPTNADACLAVLRRLLAAGNRVLLVTKPHRAIMPKILAAYAASLHEVLVLDRADRPRIPELEVRCSITCADEPVREEWEPGAPSIAERVHCLRYLRERGLRTSVSIEPCLQPDKAEQIVAVVERLATGEIWIGKLRDLRRRIAWAFDPAGELAAEDRATLHEAAEWLESQQTDEKVLDLYRRLAAHPSVRWKDSVRAVLQRHGVTP